MEDILFVKKKKQQKNKEHQINDKMRSKLRYSFYAIMFIFTIVSIACFKPLWLMIVILILTIFIIRLNLFE